MARRRRDTNLSDARGRLIKTLGDEEGGCYKACQEGRRPCANIFREDCAVTKLENKTKKKASFWEEKSPRGQPSGGGNFF